MPDTEPTSQTPSPDPWPPASMGELITMCSTPAMIGLGIVPAPGQEEPEVDLHLARHFIDLLAILDEKTAGQLDEAEQKGLDQALHELRMACVQMQQATPEQDDAAADPPSADTPDEEDESESDAEDEMETDPAETPEPQAADDQEPPAETPADSETAEGPAEDG